MMFIPSTIVDEDRVYFVDPKDVSLLFPADMHIVTLKFGGENRCVNLHAKTAMSAVLFALSSFKPKARSVRVLVTNLHSSEEAFCATSDYNHGWILEKHEDQ